MTDRPTAPDEGSTGGSDGPKQAENQPGRYAEAWSVLGPMIGVIIGGLVTLLVTNMTLNAQEEVQLRDSRAVAYLGYLDSTYGEIDAIRRLSSCMNAQSSKEPVDKIVACRKEGLGLLDVKKNKDKLQDRIYIYGSLAAIEASREVSSTLSRWQEAIMLSEGKEKDEEWSKEFDKARERFLIAICVDVNTDLRGTC